MPTETEKLILTVRMEVRPLDLSSVPALREAVEVEEELEDLVLPSPDKIVTRMLGQITRTLDLVQEAKLRWPTAPNFAPLPVPYSMQHWNPREILLRTNLIRDLSLLTIQTQIEPTMTYWLGYEKISIFVPTSLLKSTCRGCGEPLALYMKHRLWVDESLCPSCSLMKTWMDRLMEKPPMEGEKQKELTARLVNGLIDTLMSYMSDWTQTEIDRWRCSAPQDQLEYYKEMQKVEEAEKLMKQSKKPQSNRSKLESILLPW